MQDERPFGSSAPAAAFYRYSPDRKREHAEALLGDCLGPVCRAIGLKIRHTMPELRREARASGAAFCRRATLAPSGVAPMPANGLYAIKADIKGQHAEARQAVRQQRSVPILDELKAFLDATLAKTSNKSSLAQAIRYATIRRQALERFTTDGRLDICDNAAERAIRPLALGRRNWTFAGSDTGGQRSAAMYTIIETAKLAGLNPEAYLADAIDRIADHPINRIDDLLPWKWQPQQDN